MVNNKIARLIVTNKLYDFSGVLIYARIQKVIENFISKNYGKAHFEFIVTPGGFLNFEFPKKVQRHFKIEELENQHIAAIQTEAEKKVKDFFAGISQSLYRKLETTADFFTLGIDGWNPLNSQHIELVAVYDLAKKRVIHWTGKFYPTESQKKNLVKINDLTTHFLRLNNQNVIILGCHDLSVFNPRGRAVANPASWKGMKSAEFRNLCERFKPDIVIQHPHTTDTPNIWNLSWQSLEKDLPHVRHFVSGINYSNKNGNPRGELSAVLTKTKKGDVKDFV